LVFHVYRSVIRVWLASWISYLQHPVAFFLSLLCLSWSNFYEILLHLSLHHHHHLIYFYHYHHFRGAMCGWVSFLNYERGILCQLIWFWGQGRFLFEALRPINSSRSQNTYRHRQGLVGKLQGTSGLGGKYKMRLWINYKRRSFRVQCPGWWFHWVASFTISNVHIIGNSRNDIGQFEGRG
jgi:hypothetical protein